MFARTDQEQSFHLLSEMSHALELSPLTKNSLMLANKPSEKTNKPTKKPSKPLLAEPVLKPNSTERQN